MGQKDKKKIIKNQKKKFPTNEDIQQAREDEEREKYIDKLRRGKV